MDGRIGIALCITLAGLAAAPAAAGDGPLFVAQGGQGLVRQSTRFVPVPSWMSNDTTLEAISTKDGTIDNRLELVGTWGLPATAGGTEGISHDGSTLVLADTNSGQSSPSLFYVVNPRTLKIRLPITLQGYFSYDALSPDGSRLYLIQYREGNGVELDHYVVRAYDLRARKLLPGRVADRTRKSWVMHGWPVTRTSSADGRWVYTLYQNPAGYPFVHALDTVKGVAHCVGLPMRNQGGIYNLVLSLHGRRLAVHWRSGRPFLDVDTRTWQVTPAHGRSFPWWAVGLGCALLLASIVGVRLYDRSRWSLFFSRGSTKQVAHSPGG